MKNNPKNGWQQVFEELPLSNYWTSIIVNSKCISERFTLEIRGESSRLDETSQFRFPEILL